MSKENDQTRVELIHADDEERYLLRNPREIRQVLKQLVDARSLISAHLSPGTESFLTAIVDVPDGEGSLLLDGCPDEALNERVARAELLTCVTQLDKVRIQFALAGHQPVRPDGNPAFTAALPTQLLRLQRRDYYRLQTPVSETVTCTMPLTAEDGSSRSVELRILDISGSGIAIAVPPSGFALVAGARFTNCVLKLPDTAPISATLTVKNLFRLVNRNDIEMLRAGCLLSDMPRTADDEIQRYILKVERQRNARKRGRY